MTDTRSATATTENAPTPLVSIVVPVYNAERDLTQCLDSLLGQTYRNLEVICVDDGSFDGSAALIAGYAARDPRLRLIRQENAGPGVARNRGIEEAQGAYLYCFDADDWCDPTLIEKAVALLERTEADLAVLPHCEYDERVGAPLRVSWTVLRGKFPDEVISWRDNPDWILESCQNFPWNKVLRMDFVRKHQLRYQDLYLTEDLMFAGPAVLLANRIAQLDEALVFHRKGTGQNTMAAKDNHPLDFLAAFLAFKTFLEEQGLYEPLQKTYASWAAGGCLYNLNTLNTAEAFQLVYRTLAEGGAKDLGLFDVAPSDYLTERYGAFVEDLKQLSSDEYLFKLYGTTEDIRQRAVYRAAVRLDELRDLRAQLAQERQRHEAAEKKLKQRLKKKDAALKEARQQAKAAKSTAEYRVGRALCRIPRKLQALTRSKRAANTAANTDIDNA